VTLIFDVLTYNLLPQLVIFGHVSTKFECSMTLQFWVNRRHRREGPKDGRTGCNVWCGLQGRPHNKL